MKLIDNYYNFTIDFEQNKCFSLVFTNPILFREYIFKLINQEEDINISDGYNFEVITDLFNLEKNISTTIVNKINKDFVEVALSENRYLTTQKLLTEINDYAKELLIHNEYSFQLEFNDLDIENFIKSLKFHFKFDQQNFVGNLLKYFKLMSFFNKTNLFIITNLSSVLKVEEYQELKQQLEPEVNLLLLENDKMNFESNKILIDEQGMIII